MLLTVGAFRLTVLLNRSLCLWLLTLSLVGCASLPAYTLSPLPTDAVSLSFESIASRRIASDNYDEMGDHTQIGVVATASETEQWQGHLADDLIEQIEAVDYNRHFVLIVLRGISQCLPEVDMRVLQIVRQGQHVQAYAHFPTNPPLGPPQPCPAIILYPAEIVQVSKQGAWNQMIVFELMDGPRSLATVEHWIP